MKGVECRFHMKVVCDQQALDTDRIQLKDTITSLRIQLDGLKVENVSLKRKYDELSKANTHSRIAYTDKLSALTAGNNQLKAQVTGKTSSEPSTSETPKVLAPGMYNLGVNPTSGASKTVPKRAPRNHSSLPAKSANARRVEAHHRTLNKKNRVDSNLLVKHSVSVSNLNNVCDACNKSLVFANPNDCLVMSDDSVNVKPHQTKRLKRQPKKEWKPIKNVGKPIKRVWKPISKPVANSKPQQVPKGSLAVQIVLWYLDSGCSRHMTGDRARLINFVEKFIGTVRFGNDEYAAIVGYDNGTEFVNKTLDGWFESVGISHENRAIYLGLQQQNGSCSERRRIAVIDAIYRRIDVCSNQFRPRTSTNDFCAKQYKFSNLMLYSSMQPFCTSNKEPEYHLVSLLQKKTVDALFQWFDNVRFVPIPRVVADKLRLMFCAAGTTRMPMV
ncbi:hypothetical protein Tco_0655000 [Tanacetum coccineum]|uniref:Retrovirus-related Pol polyprotein from transposon TNT 1-94-like beta-barrel domain-containing protein n=1 Tax=Tanacetum coccineum TaxID=301880 RepID=A0ABQ4X4X1_9ASTR